MDLSKKNRAVSAVCVIVARLVDLMNDQVSFEQRFHSLPFVATSILNVI